MATRVSVKALKAVPMAADTESLGESRPEAASSARNASKPRLMIGSEVMARAKAAQPDVVTADTLCDTPSRSKVRVRVVIRAMTAAFLMS